MPTRTQQPRGRSEATVQRIEIVVPEGLEPIAGAELRRLAPGARLAQPAAGLFALDYAGDLRMLLGLRSVTSVYLLRRFAVPRPKALLGDENLRTILAQIERVRRLHPSGAFSTLFLSAAGADSSVLTRLKTELVARSGLTLGVDDGDLLLRLRRATDTDGWDLLTRLSPRPLATRVWRVCNLEGALSGPIAYTMARLTQPAAADRFLNIACGSGSLLIERLLIGQARRAIGCDTDSVALACARANLSAAGMEGRAELVDWDARALPLPEASIDTIAADLPFGHLVGSHTENLKLYPALLAEAARVARPGARAVLLSHEVRLMEQLLAETPAWQLDQAIRIDQSGLHPRMYVLVRR